MRRGGGGGGGGVDWRERERDSSIGKDGCRETEMTRRTRDDQTDI